ncbi:MAG TPA: excinuclease ABC subunit UvrA, partial [bacterium]|nr:excinuclease ABC subunit UvrA [bacterium]
MHEIKVAGARVHNLKNLDVTIPRDSLVVLTGVSGSGKTSLAFDTLFAEGQRRYFETLSSYSRQFVVEMERPDVDIVEGLSPAISVSQKGMPNSPRSTVGTLTEIYDYLRLLYTAVGVPHCPDCGIEIRSAPPERIADILYSSRAGAFVMILAPLVTGRKGFYKDVFEDAAKKGYTKIRVDGELRSTDEPMKLSRYKTHNIELVVDRVEVSPENRERIQDSLSTCAKESGGAIVIHDKNKKEDVVFSTRMSCPNCGFSIPKLQPRMFSFNHPAGSCKRCEGMGAVEDFDVGAIIPDAGLSVMEGGIIPLARSQTSYHFKLLTAALDSRGIDPYKSLSKYDESEMEFLLHGETGKKHRIRYRSSQGRWRFASAAFQGVLGVLREKLSTSESERELEKMKRYLVTGGCPDCGGMRLNKESLAVKVGGKSIGDLAMLPVTSLSEFLGELRLKERDMKIGGGLLREAMKRLGFLAEVGLGYLTLSR